MRISIDPDRCQGHGRCYELAPDLFGEDAEGYAETLGDGSVPVHLEDDAWRADNNCPENAVVVEVGA